MATNNDTLPITDRQESTPSLSSTSIDLSSSSHEPTINPPIQQHQDSLRSMPLDPFAQQDTPPIRRPSIEEVQFEAELRASITDAQTDSRDNPSDDGPQLAVEHPPMISSPTQTTTIQPRTLNGNPSTSQRLSQSTDKHFLTCDPISVLQSPVIFNTNEFIQTASGNKVAVKSVLCGSHKIHMAGKSIIHSGVVLRGDLASLRIGKFVSVGKGTTLRPAFKSGKNTFGYIPMSIGDYVTIGEDCVISAASISNHVVIGDHCVVGKRCILKDCCVILPGTVLPPDTVVPPMTAFGGVPGRFVGDLFESAATTQKKTSTNLYRRFLPKAS